MLHTWSLAVEEQYYILFPIFLILSWRLGIKWILALLSVVFVISLGLAHWGTSYSAHAKIISGSFFLLPARAWELLVGVFAAFYLRFYTQWYSHALNQALSLVGFTMIAVSMVVFDEDTPFPSLYALVPTVGTGLLILFAAPKTLAHALLSFKPIVGIGLISYSAYLWHQPLLAFARHRVVGEVPDLLLIMLCISSLLMAWFSWRFIEKPFRDRKVTSRRTVFSFSTALLLAFIFVGLHINYKDGFYEGLVQQNPNIKFGEIGHTEFHLQVKRRYENCSNSELQRKAASWDGLLRCQQMSVNTPKVAVFGDSHAEHLFFGPDSSVHRRIYIFNTRRAFFCRRRNASISY